MTASNTSITGSGGNTCLDIGVNLKTDHVKDEGDAKAASVELLDLVDRHEKRSSPNIESPIKVNLRTKIEPRIVFVGVKLERFEHQLIALLNGFIDFLDWSYDMPGLNTDIVVHHLPLQPGCKTVKQKMRHMKLE